jgi:hypothetical protein
MAEDAYGLGRTSIFELLDSARSRLELRQTQIELVAGVLEAQLRFLALRATSIARIAGPRALSLSDATYQSMRSRPCRSAVERRRMLVPIVESICTRFGTIQIRTPPCSVGLSSRGRSSR